MGFRVESTRNSSYNLLNMSGKMLSSSSAISMTNEKQYFPATGYLSDRYARSLEFFGRPRPLARCGGWLLERQIPGSTLVDAMGCYPRFCCLDWPKLGEDLAMMETDVVSVSLVTDPFASCTPEQLQETFVDRCVSFKNHFVVDLSRPLECLVSRHHRYSARRALKSVDVQICEDPSSFLDEWTQLYSVLIQRHGLSGIKAFSREAFAKQLQVPGMMAVRATCRGQVVGGQLWYLQGDVAYNHLAVCNEAGYQLSATYAIYWESLAFLRGRARWADLGAAGGLAEPLAGKEAGLWKFKRGWASDRRTAYFCGKIIDREAYARLVAEKSVASTDYFPAYRLGEFT